MRLIFRPLDKYVFSEFFKIFIATALGFPVIVMVIDLTDNLDKYLARELSTSEIAWSYFYWIPDSMFMVLPAAVLFATVFSIGGFTRHAEITAAKASGISFYRLTAPILLGAIIAGALGMLLAEVTPVTNTRRAEMLREREVRRTNDRFNFTYAAENGRVYKVGSLNVEERQLRQVTVERKGVGPDYPSYIMTAAGGGYEPQDGWLLEEGHMYIMPDTLRTLAFAFDSVFDRQIRERPQELMATSRAPQDMRWRELGRYITAMERSGADVKVMRVERMLKLAIPATCIVIALFGAPLATSTQRGGAAIGVGISLATTVVFLMLIQLTKAIGGRGLVIPELAAWLPNILFTVVGVVLLSRVRT